MTSKEYPEQTVTMSTPKTITILGATGTQGTSIINALHLSPIYALRAITRNPTSTAAQALTARGIEVIQADANDLASLTTAFAGSAVIFAVTDFVAHFATLGDAHLAMEAEAEQGINIARAAAATEGLEHFVAVAGLAGSVQLVAAAELAAVAAVAVAASAD